ncbi:Abi family protein [Sporosarcina sp. P1]|uniref:Abi family protein n=1 Tax=Sporosarcina sp. P1 TaxID=2048257 RepID=UPI000C16A8EE|nr:Abi family protein [Sporosarcina sp. P1]PIC82092.1 hypothetical protein CSV73_14290 [Sporosarcina sp. P1]
MTKKNHISKPFKKRKALVKLLAGRKLKICRSDKTFKKYSYYYLINGYSKIFVQNISSGIPDYTGASINDFVKMDDFDFEIRTRILKEILNIENRIKNHIFYVFACFHGDQDYLIPSNFDTYGSITKQRNIYILFSKLNNKIAQNCNNNKDRNNPAFVHYIEKYKNIPPWVLKLELTIGELSKFYSNLQSPVRQTISKEYSIQENHLSTLLYFLAQVRNKCAHNERIYDSILITKLKKNEYHDHFNDYKRNNFFSIMVALKFLMSKKEYCSLVDYVNSELNILKGNIDRTYYNKVKQFMGLPSNWKELATI